MKKVQEVGTSAERSKHIDCKSQLSICREQRELLKIIVQRYTTPLDESVGSQQMMRLIDRFHLEDPAAGTRRMMKDLRRATGMRIAGSESDESCARWG